MDATYIIEYQCVDLVRDKSLRTRDYYEAVGYYKDGWEVFEQHIMICKPSPHTSTKTVTSTHWNNNPDFEGVDE